MGRLVLEVANANLKQTSKDGFYLFKSSLLDYNDNTLWCTTGTSYGLLFGAH